MSFALALRDLQQSAAGMKRLSGSPIRTEHRHTFPLTLEPFLLLFGLRFVAVPAILSRCCLSLEASVSHLRRSPATVLRLFPQQITV